MAATFFMMRASVKTSLVLSWLGAISSLSDGSHGTREIAFSRGRRVVHRTRMMLVGESAEYPLLLFWEEARRGFLSVRGERGTIE